MRCKITVIGAGEVAAVTAAELLRADDAELVLLGLGEDGAADLRAAAEVHHVDPRAQSAGWESASGSDVVVVVEERDGDARELAARCPDAIAVVATEDVGASVERLLDATRWPRGRVVGIAGSGGVFARAARAWELVDAVVRDRGREYACTVQGDGGAVGEAVARIGADGIEAIA